MATNGKTTKKVIAEMPHSIEAEQALLGCIILEPRIQVEIVSDLNEEDFYAPSHKIVFSAINELVKNNKVVDMVILSDVLEESGDLEQIGGIEYLAVLADYMPSTANYKSYFDIVKNDSMRRKLIVGASKIIEDSRTTSDSSASLAKAEKEIYDISVKADTSEMVKISSILPDVMANIDEISKGNAAKRGIKTGFHDVDNVLNGLHKGNLIILAARPGVGKTSFAMNIVTNFALQGLSCAVFSLEMSKEELGQRMICSVAGVSSDMVNKGKLGKTEWVKLERARKIIANSNIFIDDSAIITPQQIQSKCRRLKSKFGLDLIMVDYIQLMTSQLKNKDANRQQEITEISRNLKILAKEINVPVLALSQLSRAVEQRKGRPIMSDLRESGAIEQDADIVMFIHRPDLHATEKEQQEGKVKPNVAEIIIEKNRHGEKRTINLYFKGSTTTFLNLSKDGDIEGGEEDAVVIPTKPVETTETDAPFEVEVKSVDTEEESEGTDDLFD